ISRIRLTLMLFKQSRVSEKRANQRWMASNSPSGLIQSVPDLSKKVCWEVGRLRHIDISPEVFDRIDVRRIGRQPFDREPASLTSQILLRVGASMRLQPIPKQDQPLTFEPASQHIQVTADIGPMGGPFD